MFRRVLPLPVALLCAALLLPCAATGAAVRVADVRAAEAGPGTRVVLDLSGSVVHALSTLDAPARVVIDLQRATLASDATLPAATGLLLRVRSAPRENGRLRIVLDLRQPAFVEPSVVDGEAGGTRLILDLSAGATRTTLRRASPVAAAGTLTARAEPQVPAPAVAAAAVAAAPTVASASASAPAPTPAPASAPERAPLPPARDLIIAVDAGHGGIDPGATGRKGTREKDVTLAIARLLAARIDAEPGMRAVLTRDGDYFVPLTERSRRARAAKADLFVSVHADAVANREVAGSSVYILSARGASSEAARRLAARENAADLVGGVSLSDKDPVLASVLLDLSQSATMSSSQIAAERVLAELNSVTEVHRAQVQQAGFVVLKSPDVPSMLIETAYITNPGEERRLRDPRHQRKLANAILAGIRGYFRANPPPGSRVAAQIADAGEPCCGQGAGAPLGSRVLAR